MPAKTPTHVKVTGPRGGTIAPHAPVTKLPKWMPGWLARYRRVTVTPTSHAPKPAPTGRQLLLQFAHWACANEPKIRYAEVRPIPRVKPGKLPRLPFTTDCSGFVTMACQYAGLQDPNRGGYDGSGWTGTLLAHLTRIGISRVQPGDLAVFGCKSYPNGHHVVLITAVRSRTLAGITCVSHGQDSGPFPITLATEARYQPDGPAGVVFLRAPKEA